MVDVFRVGRWRDGMGMCVFDKRIGLREMVSVVEMRSCMLFIWACRRDLLCRTRNHVYIMDITQRMDEICRMNETNWKSCKLFRFRPLPSYS